jgi:hypothetical protein
LPFLVANATLNPMPVRAAAVLLRRLLWPLLLLAASFTSVIAIAATPQRIIAVGDLHGDYQAWITIARAAGVIDAANHWSGGKTVLVQMGDITDREPDSLQIIRNLQQLQKEAPRSGGKVIVILGNHEAMNLVGDYRYTTPGEFAAFVDSGSAARRDRIYEANRARIEAAYHATDPKLTAEEIRQKWIAEHPLGWVEHKLAWSPSGELGQWATHNPAIAKIGDTLFVHGGISAEYANVPLDEVNRRVRSAMAAADDNPNSVLTDPLGPLWYRGLAGPDPDAAAERARAPKPTPPLTVDQELDAVLAGYGAKRLVIAHTPSLTGIAITNGGRLARIDTGISRYYGGPLSWLEIVGKQMVSHTVGRPAP